MDDELYVVYKYRGAWIIELRDEGTAIVMCEEGRAYGPFETVEDAEFEAEWQKAREEKPNENPR